MQRLRISDFQARILFLIRDSKVSESGGCAPDSPNSKLALYGRKHGFSTAERVTLHRSLKRLVASGLISDNGCGWCRLTEKGREWLESHPERAAAARERLASIRKRYEEEQAERLRKDEEEYQQWLREEEEREGGG
jgi:hypothetical protein